MIVCPHCQKQFGAKALAPHARGCVERPGVKELVQRLAESDVPGVAAGSEHYRQAVREYNSELESPYSLRAPALVTLTKWVGDWDTITVWCGLMTSIEHNLQRLREESRQARAILDAERNRGGALEVSSVYQRRDDRRFYSPIR